MPTSGSTNYNRTRTQIITEALQLLSVLGSQAQPEVSDLTLGSARLNAMVKAWSAEGIHLWGKTEGVIFLQSDTNSYTVSDSASSAHSCLLSDFIETAISADEASSQTTISLTSSTGMITGDYIGIELDDGTLHWTTISSVPTSTSVIIDDALTDDAAAGNVVYSYTSKITRPYRILDVRAATGSGTTLQETMVAKYSHEQYFRIVSKNQTGTRPSGFYYDPQLSAGKMYVWPTPDNVNHYLRITFERMLDDFDNSVDEPDFPQEWLEALTYNLAIKMAPAFGLSSLTDGSIIKDLQALAILTKSEAMRFDREITSVRFSRDED